LIPKSIKGKFLLLTSIFIFLGVWAPALFLFKQFRENFKERATVLIDAELEVIKGKLIDCMSSSSNKDVQALIQKMVEDNFFDVVRIHDEKGIVRFGTEKGQIGKKIEDVSPLKGNHEETKIVLLKDKGLFSAHTTIENKPICQNCHNTEKKVLAYLDVESKLTFAERNFFTGTVHTIMLGFVLAILLFIALYYSFNALIDKPVKRLENAFDELEKMNFNVQLPEDKKDEMGSLNLHFNRTVTKLKLSNKKIEELHFEQLQHADKLATLGELTSEIAHEINNPTAIISSRADYLALECEDNDNLKPFAQDLEVILKQTERISKITSNVLRYGRKLKTEFTQLKLADSLEQSLKMVELRIKKHNIELVKEIIDEDKFIYADQLQLEQLFVNLINNAIDASETGKKIVIRTYQNDKNKIIFEIKDEGSGMSEEVRKDIFSPFFTTKSEKKGTGLGLYIVKNICDNLGAEIKCSSVSGKGSSFKVTFNIIEES